MVWRMSIEKMREFGYISSEKRLPICPTCRGDMELWTGGLFVCERCEDSGDDVAVDFGEDE